MGDLAVPGQSKRIIPVFKEGQANALCLLKGAPGADGKESPWVAPGIRLGTQLVHRVQVANWGSNSLRKQRGIHHWTAILRKC